MEKLPFVKAPSFLVVPSGSNLGSYAAACEYASISPAVPMTVFRAGESGLAPLIERGVSLDEMVILYDCLARVAQFRGLHRLSHLSLPGLPRWVVGVGSQCAVRPNNRRSCAYMLNYAFRQEHFDECIRRSCVEGEPRLPWGEVRKRFKMGSGLDDAAKRRDLSAWFRCLVCQ